MEAKAKATSTPDQSTLSRRQLVKTASVAALGLAGMGKAPYVFSKKPVRLRILGTHVTLQEEIRQRAMADLGIQLEFEAKGSAAVLQKASMFPESFDLYEQWSNSINVLWRTGSIKAIDRNRIKNFFFEKT